MLDSYVYIYHLGMAFTLPILPDNITDQTSVAFSEESVIGRSAPQMTYGGSGPRSISFTLVFHRHMFALENQQIQNAAQSGKMSLPNPLTGVMEQVDVTDAADVLIAALESLMYPKYSDAAKVIVPPSVYFRFGREISIRGVPTSLTKSTSGPWLKSGKQAQVSLQISVKETRPYSAQYVALHGGYRDPVTNIELSKDLARSSVWQY